MPRATSDSKTPLDESIRHSPNALLGRLTRRPPAAGAKTRASVTVLRRRHGRLPFSTAAQHRGKVNARVQSKGRAALNVLRICDDGIVRSICASGGAPFAE